MPDIYAFLDQQGISYQRCDHPPVFTVAEAERLVPPLPGTHTKNLFLRDKKGTTHFLLVVPFGKEVDLRELAGPLGSDKLSFASPERLMKHLGIEPGAVSLLALVNDTERAVKLFVDRTLWRSEALLCHPLVNTATLVVPRQGVEKFLAATGHHPELIEVPGRE